MSADLRTRLTEAEKDAALEAGLDLSAILFGVGADLLATAGAMRALYGPRHAAGPS